MHGCSAASDKPRDDLWRWTRNQLIHKWKIHRNALPKPMMPDPALLQAMLCARALLKPLIHRNALPSAVLSKACRHSCSASPQDDKTLVEERPASISEELMIQTSPETLSRNVKRHTQASGCNEIGNYFTPLRIVDDCFGQIQAAALPTRLRKSLVRTTAASQNDGFVPRSFQTQLPHVRVHDDGHIDRTNLRKNGL